MWNVYLLHSTEYFPLDSHEGRFLGVVTSSIFEYSYCCDRKPDLATALYHYCRSIKYYPLCYHADLLVSKVFIAVIQLGKGWEH